MTMGICVETCVRLPMTLPFSLGIETDEHELEKMLKVIHELEPAGVGARNLQECLLLQLQSQSDHTPAQQLATKNSDRLFR